MCLIQLESIIDETFCFSDDSGGKSTTAREITEIAFYFGRVAANNVERQPDEGRRQGCKVAIIRISNQTTKNKKQKTIVI